MTIQFAVKQIELYLNLPLCTFIFLYEKQIRKLQLQLQLQLQNGHWVFRRFRRPKFLDDWHMKVVSLLALNTGRITPQQIPIVVISVRVESPGSHSDTKGIEPTTFRLRAHWFTQQHIQLEWSVEVANHVISIFEQVGQKRSFPFPVTCTGAKKYRTDVWWAEWVIAGI